MAKSAVDLDVNLALSKYWFNGVASFEIVMFGLRKHDFSCVFAFPSTLHDELSSLKEHSTLQGKSSYHAEIFKRKL